MILSLWMFYLGRFIVGFSVGFLVVTTAIYMQETLPSRLVESCLTSLNLGIALGIVLITVVQGLSFKDEDLKKTYRW